MKKIARVLVSLIVPSLACSCGGSVGNINRSSQDLPTFIANSPPLGKIVFKVEAEGHTANINPKALKKGIVKVEYTASPQDRKKANRLHADLRTAWEGLWPKLLKALIEIQSEYDRDTPLTKDNCEFIITQPGEHEGIDFENWGIRVELKGGDGFYSLDFDLDGNISDVGATF